jgi:hypothetical protein
MEPLFVGREAFVRTLLAELEEGSVLLEGARGIGKTRLLEHLEQHPEPGRAVLRFDLQGVGSASELVKRMEAHVQLRRGRIEDFLSTLLSDWRRDEPWDSLHQLLVQRASPGTLVLFDEVQTYLDELSRQDAQLARRELGRLDQLVRAPGHVRFLLTGSITLRSVGRALGGSLSADWRSLRLPPLDAPSSAALFVDTCPAVCAEPTLALGCAWTGGSPRWIQRLARSVRGPLEQPLQPAHIQQALQELFETGPFEVALGHLRRHPFREDLLVALKLAALPGASQASVMAGLASRGLSRPQAEQRLAVLRDEFYLDEQCRFLLPLLGEWLRRQG